MSTQTTDVQQITVQVDGGYTPDTIQVKRGQPVRIIFDRQEDGSCSEEVVFPELGIRKFLAPYSQTAVEFVPEKTGDTTFTCGMGMLRGKLVVR